MFIGVSVYVSIENGKDFSPGVGLISVNFNYIKVILWTKKSFIGEGENMAQIHNRIITVPYDPELIK